MLWTSSRINSFVWNNYGSKYESQIGSWYRILLQRFYNKVVSCTPDLIHSFLQHNIGSTYMGRSFNRWTVPKAAVFLTLCFCLNTIIVDIKIKMKNSSQHCLKILRIHDHIQQCWKEANKLHCRAIMWTLGL